MVKTWVSHDPSFSVGFPINPIIWAMASYSVSIGWVVAIATILMYVDLLYLHLNPMKLTQIHRPLFYTRDARDLRPRW